MKKSAILTTLLVTVFLATAALPSPRISNVDNYDYYFELLTFKAPEEGKTYLEVFCQLATTELRFSRSELGYRADYRVAITLNNMFGNRVAWESFKGTIEVENFHEIESVTPEIIKFPFLIKPGEYTMQIQFTDLETSENFKVEEEIHVPSYTESELQLSDLQISQSITYTDEASRAVKNNWKIEPNISRTFGARDELLYVYAELYDLVTNQEENGLVTTFSIRDLHGKELKKSHASNRKFGPKTVLVGRLPIQKLVNGDYELVVNVQDLGDGHEASKSVFFRIDKPLVRFSENSELRN